MISAQMVKDLRDKTGAGMMDCKKALSEANGDMEKAVEILREKGIASAAKKSGRIAAEGLIETYISDDKKVGSIVEVNCETDFVSAGDEFKTLATNVAKQAAYSKANTVEELNDEKYIADESMSLKDVITALIAKIGENMAVRRFEKFNAADGMVQSYIHGAGRIGVMVQLSTTVVNDVVCELAREIAMQVAAANPLFISRDEVDAETLNKEREIYRVQALNEGKPEKIVEKMVEGRVQKYFKEVCLLEQPWVRDQEYTINKLIAEKAKAVGAEIKLVKVVRFEKGEGIEKKQENLADEIQKQIDAAK